jgi:hypothetical protein
MKPITFSGVLSIFMGMTAHHHSVVAFSVTPGPSSRLSRPLPRSTSLASSTDTVNEKSKDDVIDVIATDATTSEKRTVLLDLVRDLRKQYGIFWSPLVLSKSKQDDLMDVVAAMEGEPLSRGDVLKLLPGDWDLIGTLSYIDQELPFLEPLQNALSSVASAAPSPLVAWSNRFISVTQRIRCTKEDKDEIDRVDHVIQYRPPSQLGDLVGDDSTNTSSSWWNSININPLSISKSQVILVHTAEVVDRNATRPKIRLQLQSIVNNVAGRSANLDPNGSDILGLNVPQLFPNDNNKELYDSLGGAFVTTYVDADVRISRSDVGARKQLRIFQRKAQNDTVVEPISSDEVEEEDVEGATPVEPPSDVDE